jgi:hypothetical protein
MAGRAPLASFHMPLGPSVPEWLALAAELERLSRAADSRNAVVMDAFNDLWCRAHALDDTQQPFNLLAIALAETWKVPLQSGGRIDLARTDRAPYFCAISFAGVYVLMLWFDAPFEPQWVRAVVRRALPKIESLTVSLPPPEGPGRELRSARQRD